MTLRLIKPIHVVGVLHTEKGIARTIAYLHNREPSQTVEKLDTGTVFVTATGPNVDFNKPSKSAGIKVGLELGEEELDMITQVTKQRGTWKNDPVLTFWQAIIAYSLDYGLPLHPIDNEQLKRTYEAAKTAAAVLRQIGKHKEANEIEERAFEDYIAGREQHMAQRIRDADTQINIVGRAHSEAVAGLLVNVHGLTAFPESTADAISELMVGIELERFRIAREGYKLRKMLEARQQS